MEVLKVMMMLWRHHATVCKPGCWTVWVKLLEIDVFQVHPRLFIGYFAGWVGCAAGLLGPFGRRAVVLCLMYGNQS